MGIPCDTDNRLAGPVGTTPIQWISPPGEPPSTKLPAAFSSEPGDSGTPGYLATARAQAQRANESATALARLAQAELNAGEIQAALSAAKQVLEINDSDRDSAAEFAAVQVMRAGGAASTAREHLQRTSPSDEIGQGIRARLAIECGELDEARGLVKHLSTYDGLLMGGWLALRASEHARAIALFRGATRLAGQTPDVLVNTGYSYAALGHMGHAIRATREAQALAPHRRLIAFNLVNFYLAVGEYEQASRALEPLRQHSPDDVEIALARAHIALRAGDRRGAHKILQRSRTSSSWASASPIRRAELESNLAVVRWISGQRPLAATRKLVIEQLEASDYQSLSMASLLPSLLPKFSDREQLATLLARLESRHEPDSLLFLRAREALLRRDEQASISLGVKWSETHPFNPVAAAFAMQMLGSFSNERERAIALGLEAITRAPGDKLLVNNVAYALALEGRTREARTVLGKIATTETTPAVVATRGLVEMISGNVRVGMKGYADAGALASKQGDEAIARLAELNLELALLHMDRDVLLKLDIEAPQALQLKGSAADDPAVWLLGKRAEHEGIPVFWEE
jgi:Flp pilus assembly protein TadD